LKFKAAHKHKQVDKKDIGSLPRPADQKLTEGRKIIKVANLFIHFFLFDTANCNATSKNNKPIDPKTPKINEIFKKDKSNISLKKAAGRIAPRFPNEVPKSTSSASLK
jgi:hypothetical protein